MKTLTRNIIVALMLSPLFCMNAFADTPPDPPGGGPGGGDLPVGGGAPLDGGLTILIALGAIYSGKKTYQAFKNK